MVKQKFIYKLRNPLNEGKQILILVPEIGLHLKQLTVSVGVFPIRQLCGTQMTIVNAYQHGERQKIKVLLLFGTRSACFCLCKIGHDRIVDEEHDLSFKQQDSLRYHARLACFRAAGSTSLSF